MNEHTRSGRRRPSRPTSRPNPERKICLCCGRPFGPRKKWARDWAEVRYCSRACRRRGAVASDERMEAAILALVARRGARGSICPSEAARAFASPRDQEWPAWCACAREAAQRLAKRGLVDLAQRGRVIDPALVRGPIRVRVGAIGSAARSSRAASPSAAGRSL